MQSKFITISASYIPNTECWLLISDYRWYNQNYMDIKLWAETCLSDGFKTEGMVIKFVNDAERNLFLMKWNS